MPTTESVDVHVDASNADVTWTVNQLRGGFIEVNGADDFRTKTFPTTQQFIDGGYDSGDVIELMIWSRSSDYGIYVESPAPSQNIGDASIEPSSMRHVTLIVDYENTGTYAFWA